ncbi:MAG: MBOAT family protein [Melioribacteraceae bacterium]|nr:MBOAT family protein [Melioribacteraceae bacterium]MCF8356871.1 MBOAT family protein [Melioribacteraceae bacterium]MCF8394528.1 MBOAT family protein [Melioribacteraceae bacterium]MCF8420144.1 MBOAT family protein [Melioribacteraceae bacterium]
MIDKLLDLLAYNPEAPMLFNSGFFMFFFFFVLVFHYLFINYKRAKIVFLTIMSLYFYYKSSGLFFYLIIISSIIDYYAGLWIHQTEIHWKRKSLLFLSIVTNLGILGYFKYTNFFIDTINEIGAGNFDMMNIFLPVGVSFFTFQSMSYTFDIYRNKLNPEKNFLDFIFFVSFFPQLVAGPIVRASDFLPQIHKEPFITKEDIGKSIFLIVSGLFKKAVLADYISINFVDRVFEIPGRFTGVENLLAIYGYGLQIYCDFSGYSDMAIGLALMLGFRLPTNFDSPYQSASITEFWRRWHISLSSWLKDYLYIFGLGGNRKGNVRTYINLMLTMLLGGLWHGASWKFVFWGGLHGGFLAFEKMFNIPKWVNKNKLTRIVGIIITFHLVSFCWIFFRAQSFELGWGMLDQIFNNFQPAVFFQFVEGYSVVFVMIIIGYILHYIPRNIELRTSDYVGKMPLLGKVMLLVVIIWIVAQAKTADIQPFIYFQF